MTTLHDRLQTLAGSFAGDVIEALRGASLQDLLSEAGVRSGTRPSAPGNGAPDRSKPSQTSGRLRRRSPDDIAKALASVVGLVRTRKQGLRAEQIRAELQLSPKEMPRVLKEGLARKQLRSKGQKRATTYFSA